MPLAEALESIEEIDNPNSTHLVRFIRDSKRGFARASRRHAHQQKDSEVDLEIELS